MVKQFWLFLFFVGLTGILKAQDMPPLPPMGDQPAQPAASNAGSPALPPLPDQPAATAGNTAQPALPPLPDQQSPSTTQAAPAGNAAQPGMPPLPDQTGATPGTNAPAASTTNPPLPGDQSQPSTVTQEATPAETPAASTEATPEKKTKQLKPWQESRVRPNVIFGGWVRAKGGNVSSRLSWTSQEVLNALDLKKYKFLKEDGLYLGQTGGPQWREFTFKVPKSKSTVKVYIREVGKRVWLRVGPDQPPATNNQLEAGSEGLTLNQTKKMRSENFKVLSYLKKKFGRRLAPNRVIPSWEARFKRPEETADAI
jgi:hypothetical protein